MFYSARLKLTAWYLLIIMFISILFSIIVYRIAAVEVERSLRAQQFRIFRQEHPALGFFPQFHIEPPPLDLQLLNEEKNRIKLILVFIDVAIFVLAGGAGYFLAGRTLKPIQEMVDEQNRFITDASHELRTPLTALRSEIEVNLRDKNLSLKDAKALLHSNLEEVGNLQVLSDSLLQLTQFHFQFETLSLADIIDEAVKKVIPLAKAKQITIEPTRSSSQVKGDKQTLTQLFVIILDNAIKYSPEGKSIRITAEKTDHSILIHITDQGIGVDKKDIPHIFDRFYRADTSRTKDTTPGYGLGLSIAKKIVEEHAGLISVKSSKAIGSTFTVQLPTN